MRLADCVDTPALVYIVQSNLHITIVFIMITSI